MSHLWLTLCLVAAAALPLRAAGQQPATTYYCDKFGRTVLIDAPPAEFLLVTAYPDSTGWVSPGMRCRFRISALYDGSLLQVDIERNPSLPPPPSSGLEISETFTNRVLAATDQRAGSDRRVPLERASLVSRPGNDLSVSFDTPNSIGSGWQPVAIRLRRFVNCPPGWRDLDGFCFSPVPNNGSGRQFDYATSQVACNAMRSNLLMSSFRGGASKYLGNYSLANLYTNVLGYQYDAWVGLTDSHEHFRWLDGTYFSESPWFDGVRCASSLSWINYQCRDDEQCAYFQAATGSVLRYSGPVMDRCRYPSPMRRFACYMPRNGTDLFYRVPNEHVEIRLLIWVVPTVCVCFAVFVVLLALGVRRQRLRHRRAHGDCRQPILAVPPPPCYEPQYQYDAYGRPVQWYGAAGQGQHPPHHQPQHPPHYQPQHPPPCQPDPHDHCKG